MNSVRRFLLFLKNLDRRVIFAFVLLAVIIPMLNPMALPITVSPPVEKAYDFIQNQLEPGDIVLMSFEYDPSTKPEIHPGAEAIINHFFARNIKIVTIALWPQGAQLADSIYRELAVKYNKQYGVDYVNMGYKAGGSVIIQALGTDFPGAFPTDIKGTPVAQIPLMQQIKTYKDLNLIVSLSAGDPGVKQYVAIAEAQYEIPVIGGVTAVTAPEIYPYVGSGQVTGLLGGMKGAAEYEKLVLDAGLVDQAGTATAGMDAQSIVHLVIILFIIIANAIYLTLEKGRERKLGSWS